MRTSTLTVFLILFYELVVLLGFYALGWFTDASEAQVAIGIAVALGPPLIALSVWVCSRLAADMRFQQSLGNQQDGQHPIIFVAVLPVIFLLFAVATFVFSFQPSFRALINDFEMRQAWITQLVLAATQFRVMVFVPPTVLSVLMVWYARRSPVSHALCVVIGCAVMGVLALLMMSVAMVLPFTQLIINMMG